ncbi:MAG: tetratricopeptide repeat protein [Gemmatimonadetes bacterium]|nr:tetratricopeptide repeat protein [Gemmatimonadota bacterium]
MSATSLEARLSEAMRCARTGQFGRAEQLALTVLADAPIDGCVQARAANLLGGIAFEQGRLHEAEERFELVLRQGRLIRDGELVARAANNLASIAHMRGKPQLAASLYQGALGVWRRLGHEAGVAQTCHNLALLAREGGAHERAAELAEEAVAAASRTSDVALQSLVRVGRAEAALALSDFAAAHANVECARRLARASGDWLGVADGRRAEARVALAEGRPGAALRAALAGYHRARRLGATHVATECAELAGQAAAQLRRHPNAERFYRLAHEGYLALGLPRGRSEPVPWLTALQPAGAASAGG